MTVSPTARLGNRPSALAAPGFPSFTDWPTPSAHPVPAGSNWTLDKLRFNMPRWTHNAGGPDADGEGGAVLRVAGAPSGGGGGSPSASMVAQLFQPRAPTLARIDLWLRLTASAQPKMPYISYYVAALGPDGMPDTEHPVMCATQRPKPDIVPYASGKLIKCGLHATELSGLVDPNATAKSPAVRANSSAWRPIKLFFNPEEVRQMHHPRAGWSNHFQ